MIARQARTQRSLRLAFLVSLVLHGLVLFLHRRESLLSSTSSPIAASRLDVAITKPAPRLEAPASAAKPQPRNSPKVLTAPGTSPRRWSRAERDEMNSFLDSLSPPKSPTGRELAQRGRAMARDIGREGTQDDSAAPPIAMGSKVDAFSLEMYMDAFLRKMNRSAAFVRRDPQKSGKHVAQVLVTLNADGSLQSFKVLWAADQQAEIDYIRSVVERASPFAAFPPDIKRGLNTMSVMMCITPKGEGSGFTRIFDSRECRD